MAKKLIEIKPVKPKFMTCWFCCKADSKHEIVINRTIDNKREVTSFFICDECLEALTNELSSLLFSVLQRKINER